MLIKVGHVLKKVGRQVYRNHITKLMNWYIPRPDQFIGVNGALV